MKLNTVSIFTASLAAAALLVAGCMSDEAKPSGSASYANGKATIDGGNFYETSNNKYTDYAVNPNATGAGFKYGRTPTANELNAWNTDVTPWKLPPEGEGSVEDGEEIYEEKCLSCHGDFGSGGGGYPSLSKGNAYDLQKTLTNQRVDGSDEGPARVFGTYWPEASTLWWYIHDGMPHPKTKSLTHDEVYALTAYILNLNEMEIDGEEVDDEYVLNQEKFAKIKMPNRDGFEPEIRGKDGIENVRKYYADAKNFGGLNLNQGAVRCMKDCQEPTVKVVRISGGITDFLPPMNTTRDLPKAKNAPVAGKAEYEASCAVCHGAAGMGAPVVGNKKDWAKYIAHGEATMVKNAIMGTDGGMPPKGGSDLSDAKIKEVVQYMVNSSK